MKRIHLMPLIIVLSVFAFSCGGTVTNNSNSNSVNGRTNGNGPATSSNPASNPAALSDDPAKNPPAATKPDQLAANAVNASKSTTDKVLSEAEKRAGQTVDQGKTVANKATNTVKKGVNEVKKLPGKLP
jgi:hypothetical protein